MSGDAKKGHASRSRGGPPKLSDLEQSVAEIFEIGDLDKHLEHLSEKERAKALVDLHTYRHKSERYKATLSSQASQQYVELYTRAVKHMEETHGGTLGFHPDLMKKAKPKDRERWADHLLDVALAHYTEKRKGLSEAKEKFPHIYGEHRGEEHHEDHGTATEKSARKYSTKKEREMLVDSLFGQQGAYKALIEGVKLSKNIVEDLKNDKSLLHQLFKSIATQTTDYAMRGVIVDHNFDSTYDGNHKLVQDVGVKRINEWGKAAGHEYGLNPTMISTHDELKEMGKAYLTTSADDLKDVAMHGKDKVRYISLKGGGAAPAAGGHH